MVMWKTYRDVITARYRTQEGAVWMLWVLTGARTMSYFAERTTVLSHLIDRVEFDWLSPALWSVAWMVCTVAILTRSRIVTAWAMGVSTSAIFMWGLLFLWSAPVEFLSRGSVYLTLCGFIVWGTIRADVSALKEVGYVDKCPGHRG